MKNQWLEKSETREMEQLAIDYMEKRIKFLCDKFNEWVEFRISNYEEDLDKAFTPDSIPPTAEVAVRYATECLQRDLKNSVNDLKEVVAEEFQKIKE